jgi:iron complex outermembrane receptor protein
MVHGESCVRFFRTPFCGALVVSLVCSHGALAQTSPPGGGSVLMEEIVVTAQKREQNAQDVGIAITALSGEQIRALGYTNAQEVTALAPGVSTVQPNGEANYAIAIRGVASNDFVTNVESPVAVYVDEVYISQMSGAGFLLFDVDRVEMLRGPQGTLFGRNATGGLVQYVTVKPTQEFNGYGSATYGSYDRLKLQGAVTVPLNDKASMRVSAATHQGDGYAENRLRPDQKLNNANETAGRVQLLWEPNDEVSLLLNARYGQQDIRTGFWDYESAIFPTGEATPGVPNSNLGGYVDTDGDVFTGDYDFAGHNELETDGYTATLNWNTSIGTLTSITDYQTLTRDYIEDSDASPVDYFDFFLTTDSKQFSQELRLAGDTDKLKWVGGLYYLDLDIDDSNGGITRGLFEALFGDTVENLGFDGVRNPYQTKSESWSIFGQLEYALTEQWALIGGVRWIEEDKTHDYHNLLVDFPDTASSGLDPNAAVIGDAVTPFHGERNDGNWSARAQVNFKPSSDLLLYASWYRGVKSGGFNAPLLPTAVFVTDDFMNYGPEKLDAYETGFKWDTLDAKLRFNGAFYYYDYKNYQAFSIIGLDTFTLNAQAKNKGFELELQANPAKGLDLQLGTGYIDADVTDVPGLTIDVSTPAGDVSALLPGATVTPVQTPKWNVSGLARYEFPVGDGHLALQADAAYRSKHFFALTGFPASTENGYTVANASATWFAASEKWSARLFVTNLTDEEYLVQTFDLSGNVDNGGLFGLIERYYGRPRMYGLSFNYTF